MPFDPASDDLFFGSLERLTPSATAFAPAPVVSASEARPETAPAAAVAKTASEPQTKEAPPAQGTAADVKLRIALNTLKTMERSLKDVIRLLEEDGVSVSEAAVLPTAFGIARIENDVAGAADGRVLEGVFDGQQMVASDGKNYPMPPNYASKSKLVEGDLLKLTITSRGTFIYKQIGPIERGRIVAELGFDPMTNEYYAAEGTRRWNVLKASVTYFKGEAGDEVVILVPKGAPSKWAAVENIIKKEPAA